MVVVALLSVDLVESVDLVSVDLVSVDLVVNCTSFQWLNVNKYTFLRRQIFNAVPIGYNDLLSIATSAPNAIQVSQEISL